MAVRLTSFPPVVGPVPRVLILGSMPGKRSLDPITLPSTSPANASKPLHQKLAQWQRILRYLPPLDNKQDSHV